MSRFLYRRAALYSILVIVIGLPIYWQSASKDSYRRGATFSKPLQSPAVPAVPKTSEYSFAKAVKFIDEASVNWTREKKCGTCHTNYTYLLARPFLKEPNVSAQKEVRSFFEHRFAEIEKTKDFSEFEIVAIASYLTFNDARSSGKLSATARRALDWMWKLQQPAGDWPWPRSNRPPMESNRDGYYGATIVGLGVGAAPDNYQRTPQAQAGLERLRNYFKKNPPPNLHQRLMLLWVSTYIKDLVTVEEATAAIKEVSELQHDDGGWALPGLGNWKRLDGTPNAGNSAPSDGYGTGFVLFILHEAKVPKSDPRIQKGLAWLKSHQSEDGSWFTHSLTSDKTNYISHAGTAFAAMALRCYEDGC